MKVVHLFNFSKILLYGVEVFKDAFHYILFTPSIVKIYPQLGKKMFTGDEKGYCCLGRSRYYAELVCQRLRFVGSITGTYSNNVYLQMR